MKLAFDRKYKVALYIRLSREDGDKEEGDKSESESITNQRSLLRGFVEESGLEVAEEYIDDGCSGTNFERPAFKKMIADIEKRKIDMVITKDLSRLGRDYIDTGNYIEKFFPLNRVRYIALLDNVDTFLDNSSSNDIVPFKAVINDMYVKDLSKKVKSAMTSKKEKGLFLGTYAPYGYNKDPLDKNRLVINEEEAKIVRKIFKLYLEGNGPKTVARLLTEEKIPTPSESKKMTRSSLYGKWCSRQLKDMLKNQVYIGNLVQNKMRKLNYKSKKLIRTDKNK